MLMLTVTDRAGEALRATVERAGDQVDAVRISASPSPDAKSSEGSGFRIDVISEQEGDDAVVVGAPGGPLIFIASDVAPLLDGSTLDTRDEEGGGSTFVLRRSA
jgi:Fe-S cluster assembly iron-binding protein IscA